MLKAAIMFSCFTSFLLPKTGMEKVDSSYLASFHKNWKVLIGRYTTLFLWLFKNTVRDGAENAKISARIDDQRKLTVVFEELNGSMLTVLIDCYRYTCSIVLHVFQHSPKIDQIPIILSFHTALRVSFYCHREHLSAALAMRVLKSFAVVVETTRSP